MTLNQILAAIETSDLSAEDLEAIKDCCDENMPDEEEEGEEE